MLPSHRYKVLYLLCLLLFFTDGLLASTFDPNRPGNLYLSNYSFEIEAAPDRPDGWYYAAGLPVTYGYVRDGTEGVDCFKGSHAITMSNPTGNNGRWFSTVTITPGRSLLLAFWFKTENLATGVRFQPVIEWAQTGVGAKTPSFLPAVTTDKDWTFYSHIIENPPLGADRATVTLKFEAGSAGPAATGTVYIDEIFFGEVPVLSVMDFEIVPNPISFADGEQIVISYELSEPGRVIVSLYNLAGNKIGDLLSENQNAGPQQLSWDGRVKGTKVRKGLYILSVSASGANKERAVANKLLYILD